MANTVNHIRIGNVTYNLGDLRKADFDGIPDPKASVKSCQTTLIAILNILRGHEDEESGS